MADRITLVTPVARIVAGDLWEPRTKDFQGNPLKYKSGPNEGQDRVEYFIALAIPKTAPEWPAIHQAIYKEAMRGFPNHFDQNGNHVGPKFAWKLTDGDSQVMNLNGVRPCDKEGYPGHWVLSCGSTIAPKVYDRNNALIAAETRAIKRGDYVRAQISFVANEQAANPGLYMGANMVQFSHQGVEITSGPDAASVFGVAPAAPAGANITPQPSLNPMPIGGVGFPNVSTPAAISAPPVSPANTSAPAVGGMPQGGMGVAPNAVPAQNNAGMSAGSPHVTPAPDFLNGPATAPPPAAPEQFVINGQAYTRDQLIGAGWTNEQINAQPRA